MMLTMKVVLLLVKIIKNDKFDIKDNFNIYNLCTTTGNYELLRDGNDDQPDLTYKYPNDEIKSLFKDT
jgi:hypothetical protein